MLFRDGSALLIRLVLPLTLVLSACPAKDEDTSAADDSDADADADGDADSDADADGDTDADADADADSDADSDSEFFLVATGVFNGTAFSVDCDSSEIIAARSTGGGMESVNGICIDTSVPGTSVAVSSMNPSVGVSTTCDLNRAVQVTVDSLYYACMLGGTTSFEMDITESEITKEHVIWGGTFVMAGADASNSADVTGSFRVRSVAY